jgi:hypothetical protein
MYAVAIWRPLYVPFVCMYAVAIWRLLYVLLCNVVTSGLGSQLSAGWLPIPAKY